MVTFKAQDAAASKVDDTAQDVDAPKVESASQDITTPKVEYTTTTTVGPTPQDSAASKTGPTRKDLPKRKGKSTQPLPKIPTHPYLAFKPSVLTIKVGFPADPNSEAFTQAIRSMFNTLSQYHPLTKVIHLTLRTKPNSMYDSESRAAHIAITKLIIEEIDKFPDIKEVVLRTLLEKWDFEKFSLAAAVFGLGKRWKLGYRVDGRGVVKVFPGNKLLQRLGFVHRHEF